MNFRTGFGFDVHALSEDRPLWLGGIEIPAEKGAVGHSDADVLLHAICDALLGAAALRDIGYHFPDTDASYKGVDSKLLLKKVMDLLHAEGYVVGNIDSTLCLEQPKINPHIPRMCETISSICGIGLNAVSIKATTNEKLGYIGRREGIAAFATVLIYRKA
jgi:2-C-methyl-D-erythritol 2,4-cyclodiphosphate synthase